MSNIDYHEIERADIIDMFDVVEVLSFEELNNVSIFQGDDFMHQCWINQEQYATGLTVMGALVYGIRAFKEQMETKAESRCCGRCDGINDMCVSDMTCGLHGALGCEICYGPRQATK